MSKSLENAPSQVLTQLRQWLLTQLFEYRIVSILTCGIRRKFPWFQRLIRFNSFIKRGRLLLLPNVKASLFLQLILVLVSDLDTIKPEVWLNHQIWSVTKAIQNHSKEQCMSFYQNKFHNVLQLIFSNHKVTINPFLPNIPFWSCWKHQKTKGFLMFSGWSKGNIEKKRV